MDLTTLYDYSDELVKRLHLRTYPLAVKLIEREEQIPQEAMRPMRDEGYHYDLCQAFALCRREATTVALLIDDMWCFEPVIGYGMAEPPQGFLDGKNRYPQDVASMEAGSHYAADLPKMPIGKYIGVVAAPLHKTTVVPDVVAIYADSEQISLLLLAREHKDGHDLSLHLSSHAACVYGIVPSMKSGECNIAIPCRGDHYNAMAGNDEMIFSMPLAKIDEIMTGLRFLERNGCRIPRSYKMQREPLHPQSYHDMAAQLGMASKRTKN
jgi:uncharacterized protein (DUF169 family)